tara:strand:+ start:112 stop:588 length:477 start_codon:yes stop_codon:yes gene_type:complete
MWVGAEGGGRVEAMNQDKFDAPQSSLGAAFMGALANNPVARIQNAINSRIGTNNAGSMDALNTSLSNTGFQNVGLLGSYPGFNAVSNVTNTGMTPQSGWGSYHGQTNQDDPRWEGPLTSVNTISNGNAEIEAQIEAEIESQANGGRGWGGVGEGGREN